MESKIQQNQPTQDDAGGWGGFTFNADTQNPLNTQVIINNQLQTHQEEEKKQHVAPDHKKKGKRQSKFDKLQEQVDEEIRAKWELEQNTLKLKLIEEDAFDWVLDQKNPNNTTLKLIGAIDISYSKKDDQKAVAAIIVCEYPSMKIVYQDYEHETAHYPYIPGFLAFKEVPVYTILFDRLRTTKPEFWPQVLLVDGNGILHNRGFGCASHVGVLQDLPTIGVGKNVFAVDGITQLGVKDLCEKYLVRGGDLIELVGKSGKVWGAALRSTEDSKNPIIISVGHRISLKTSIQIVKACIHKFRIPEPIRQADLKSRALVKKHYDS